MTDGHEPYPEAPDGNTSAGRTIVQEARWRTVSVLVPIDLVRAGLERTFRRGVAMSGWSNAVAKGLPTRDGFVLEFRVGRRRIGAELTLGEHEGATRVQISIPADSKVSSDELDGISKWLAEVLLKAEWG